MDFHSLKLFQHLAGSLHFASTAKALHVSPSALSRTIQRMEQECQTQLFIRTNKQVKLTAAGRELVNFCQQVLPQWTQLKHTLADKAQQLSGELTLFCSVTASVSHLPDLLSQFRQQFPQVELKIITGDPSQAVVKVQEGSVDSAIAIHTRDFPADLYFLPLSTLPLCLISSKQSNITQLQQIDWQQVQWVMPESGAAQQIVLEWLSAQRIQPLVYANVAGNEAIVSMVALDCGVGIVPEVVLDHSLLGQKVNRMPLADIAPYQLGLCCLSERKQEPVLNAILTSSATR